MKPQKHVVALGALLFVSLAGNLFLSGLLLGKTWEHRPGWMQKDDALKLALSEPDRAVLRAAMDADRAALSALKDEVRGAKEEVKAAVRAGDNAALDAALARESEVKKALLLKMQQSREAVMEKLSPEGQKALADYGVAARGRYKWKKHGHEQDGEGGFEDPDLMWYAGQP